MLLNLSLSHKIILQALLCSDHHMEIWRYANSQENKNIKRSGLTNNNTFRPWLESQLQHSLSIWYFWKFRRHPIVLETLPWYCECSPMHNQHPLFSAKYPPVTILCTYIISWWKSKFNYDQKKFLQELTIMLISELNYQHSMEANAFSTLYVAGAIVKEQLKQCQTVLAL